MIPHTSSVISAGAKVWLALTMGFICRYETRDTHDKAGALARLIKRQKLSYTTIYNFNKCKNTNHDKKKTETSPTLHYI